LSDGDEDEKITAKRRWAVGTGDMEMMGEEDEEHDEDEEESKNKKKLTVESFKVRLFSPS
jgi:hypothetical protein